MKPSPELNPDFYIKNGTLTKSEYAHTLETTYTIYYGGTTVSVTATHEFLAGSKDEVVLPMLAEQMAVARKNWWKLKVTAESTDEYFAPWAGVIGVPAKWKITWSDSTDYTGSPIGSLSKHFDLKQRAGKCALYSPEQFSASTCAIGMSLQTFVIHMNDEHRWTRNQIADEIERRSLNINMKAPQPA